MNPKAVLVLSLMFSLYSLIYGCEIEQLKAVLEELEVSVRNMTQSGLEILDKNIKNDTNAQIPDSQHEHFARAIHENCAEIKQNSKRKLINGIYTIQPSFWYIPIHVYCDFRTVGGGWTLIQRRDNYSVQENFNRNWEDYKNGFGSVKKDFWLGNDIIFALTNNQKMVLRIDMEDFEGGKVWVEYLNFYLESGFNNFKLRFDKYTGNVGDALTHNHKDNGFTTSDKDNDNHDKNCALIFQGGWWYSNCETANLNGPYRGKSDIKRHGVRWYYEGTDKHSYKYYLKKVEMKIRPCI